MNSVVVPDGVNTNPFNWAKDVLMKNRLTAIRATVVLKEKRKDFMAERFG